MEENLEKNEKVPPTEAPTQEQEMDPTEVDSESRIFESGDIDASEHDVIKGDTVGETMYSAKWILSTLISLSEIYEGGWNESIESDLCTLWDMTAEPDIVEFLMQNDFFKMAEFTLKISEEPRLTEIIVGIIGNMSCNAVALQSLVESEKLKSTILPLISSDDKETILQVLRILQAAMWDIQNNSESPWVETLKEYKVIGVSIPFILNSSRSEELLASTIDVVYSITEIATNNENILVDIFDVNQLILALGEAMTELIQSKADPHTEIQLKCIDNWLNIMFNIMKQNLLRFSDCEDDENFKKMISVLSRILLPYEKLSNVTPLEEQCAICIHSAMKMVLSFQKSDMFPDPSLFSTVMKVMINLASAVKKNEFDDCDRLRNLCKYMENYWTDTLKTLNDKKISEIFTQCDEKTICQVLELSKSLPDISEDGQTNLARIKPTMISTI